MRSIIDAHIHLDRYEERDRRRIVEDLSSSNIEKLISVSYDFDSCKKNLSFDHPKVVTALGFHPEQALPSPEEVQNITELIYQNRSSIAAIGEVGLPYYTQHDDFQDYVNLLEHFIILGKELQLPVNLHAIYEGADIACDLLEKHEMTRAHFHWFKGSETTQTRMKEKGYMVSVTPDCVYEEEIRKVIESFPLEQLMVETDGPWPFENKFEGRLTHPMMIHDSVKRISELKDEPLDYVYKKLQENTCHFYKL
ncbi:TatD family hydrolase [Halobacillus salinus]|uniref:TatD family hydrolase n=1 Tax=Halobacillus salinus TaxID=192814 RepID=UPI0009A61CE3|nr:TatD family hydrolase [Halobacillus salinus]